MDKSEKGNTADGHGAVSPAWFESLEQKECVVMDVRPILGSGVDPLDQILAKVGMLSSDDVLMIEAPFDPIPLRRLLTKQGYDSHAQQKSDVHWQAFFKKNSKQTLPDFPDLPSFPMTFRDDMLELDLRGLEPPNPMIAVLKLIESGQGEDGFMAYLMRDPIYLYPELTERGWRVDIIREDDKGIYVSIIKQNEGDIS